METILPAILSLLIQADEVKPNYPLFPSVLEDKRCYPGIGTDTTYRRWLLTFNSVGQSGMGNAYYTDSNCNSFSHLLKFPISGLPYAYGGQTMSAENYPVDILLFPNPETSIDYGTVYIEKQGRICFAETTIQVTEFTFGFVPTSIAGDFSGKSIESEYCMRIVE